MIDFDQYNIKIRYFVTHPAGLKPTDDENKGEPFIVIHNKWWNGEKETWKDLPNQIKEWCENHRNECLIIHKLSPMGIRFSKVN